MVKNSKHIAQIVEESLRDAIREVNTTQGVSKSIGEIHFKRVVFNQEHNLVVIEIGEKQRRNLPELLFAASMLQQSKFTNSNFSKVDILELVDNTYIYFWVTSNEHFEAENLAYAI